jgi:phytanoyl-CoA hydroxylase
MLTPQDIAAFHRDGFVCIENVFGEADLARLRRACETPEIREPLTARRVEERLVHLIPLTSRHDAFRGLAKDPRLTSRVAALLGDDLQLYSSKLATKPSAAGQGEFAWHQDFPYFPHTHAGLVAVSVALDDCTPDNGGMYALAGSHQKGLLSHEEDGWMTGRCTELVPSLDDPQVRPLMSAAGGITLHHSLTLHCSGPNWSGTPRRLAIFEYRAGSALQLAGYLWDDTGWQVHGEPAGLVRCDPLLMRLPRNVHWGKHTGEVHGNSFRQKGAIAIKWNNEIK